MYICIYIYRYLLFFLASILVALLPHVRPHPSNTLSDRAHTRTQHLTGVRLRAVGLSALHGTGRPWTRNTLNGPLRAETPCGDETNGLARCLVGSYRLGTRTERTGTYYCRRYYYYLYYYEYDTRSYMVGTHTHARCGRFTSRRNSSRRTGPRCSTLTRRSRD